MNSQVLDPPGVSELIIPEGAVITFGERLSLADFNRNTLMALRLSGTDKFFVDNRFYQGFRLAANHLTNLYGDKLEIDYITYKPMGDYMPGLDETLHDLCGVFLQVMMPSRVWYFDIDRDTAEKVIMGDPNSPHSGLRTGSNCGLSLEVWMRMAQIVHSVWC